jgi:hypothetical protein
MRGQVLFKGEIIIKMSRWGGVIKKFFSGFNGLEITEIYMKAF